MLVQGKACPKGSKIFSYKNKQTNNTQTPNIQWETQNYSQYEFKENMFRHAIKMGCKSLIKTSLVSKQEPIDDA